MKFMGIWGVLKRGERKGREGEQGLRRKKGEGEKRKRDKPGSVEKGIPSGKG